jgi:hypothetical protein
MTYIRDNGPGIIIYLQQEGRGMGLGNKIKAYHLQEVIHFLQICVAKIFNFIVWIRYC